jgi:hypothetical protein
VPCAYERGRTRRQLPSSPLKSARGGTEKISTNVDTNHGPWETFPFSSSPPLTLSLFILSFLERGHLLNKTGKLETIF